MKSFIWFLASSILAYFGLGGATADVYLQVGDESVLSPQFLRIISSVLTGVAAVALQRFPQWALYIEAAKAAWAVIEKGLAEPEPAPQVTVKKADGTTKPVVLTPEQEQAFVAWLAQLQSQAKSDLLPKPEAPKP